YKNASNLMARANLHARFSTNPYGWMKWFFDQIEAPADAKVLEVGAGPGMLWRENAERIPPGWQVTLSDFSPGMVAEQQDNLRDVPGKFTCEVIDAQSIPYGDGTFDAVIANHMLYHVPDIARALREIFRVLKPAGRLYAATNGETHMHELRDLLRSYGKFGLSQVSGLAFTLENGMDWLKPVFADVTLRLYPDELVVNEVRPLVDYILSAWTFRPDAPDASVEDFTAFVERALHENGAIHISKSVGVFVAARA
ncbi:MAG: class I SAM-dependent methyltransferase, partial [Anaerolineae bacterium]|nr:class I SAM-dependent methyltransferase [Anaerolineae bacterium]